MEKQLFTVAVFSENQVGLLNQISIIYTRRSLNIESLSVSPSSIKGVHKFTITTWSDRETMEKVIKQIEKRIEVLKAFLYTDDDYKVPTSRLLEEENLESIIRSNNARILEITQEYTVIEKAGHSDETESLFEQLKRYDIKQFVRSGRVAVTKSPIEFVNLFLEGQELRRQKIES